MDTLIKSLQVRGHQIRSTNEATEIIINNQKLKISLREKTKRIPGKEQWSYSEYQPTGTLVLKLDEIFHYKEWSDSKLILEEQISAIIAKLELITSAIIARELIWQKERDQKEHLKQLKKDWVKRQIQDLEDFKEMIRKASRWHKANNLRAYIKTVEVKATGNNKLTAETKYWIEWAFKKADWYDPFVETEDDLLNEVAKEFLAFKQKSSYF